MKMLIYSLAFLCCITISAFSHNFVYKNVAFDRDEMIFKEAYRGNYSLVQKLMITREGKTAKDIILNQFIMAYVYYRIRNYEDAERMFKTIDNYIETYLIHNDCGFSGP